MLPIVRLALSTFRLRVPLPLKDTGIYSARSALIPCHVVSADVILNAGECVPLILKLVKWFARVIDGAFSNHESAPISMVTFAVFEAVPVMVMSVMPTRLPTALPACVIVIAASLLIITCTLIADASLDTTLPG